MPKPEFPCQICGTSGLKEIPFFGEFSRVTSDCRPFGKGGQLTVCVRCGGIQKLPTQDWYEEISRIYAGYEAYYQADGEEQIVFDAGVGRPRPRSEVFLDRLQSSGFLSGARSVLDVGCGSGVTLKAIQKILPRVQLSGYELTDKNADKLFKISNFVELFVGELEEIGEKFDFVSMVHSLEHFSSPFKVLVSLKEKINPDGILFVEVCNVDSNPFDLLIADHLMHFTPQTLTELCRRAGFDVMHVATDWVNKEISLVARVLRNNDMNVQCSNVPQEFKKVNQRLNWLAKFMDVARKVAIKPSNFGVFGTSISATLVASELTDAIDFFVDEDDRRVGKTYLGKPVLRPTEIPANSQVFLALVPQVAGEIKSRFSHLQVEFILPPSFDFVLGPE